MNWKVSFIFISCDVVSRPRHHLYLSLAFSRLPGFIPERHIGDDKADEIKSIKQAYSVSTDLCRARAGSAGFEFAACADKWGCKHYFPGTAYASILSSLTGTGWPLY